MSDTPKELKLVFAPGCFDSFDGTQDELDELMRGIQASFDSGELLDQGTMVDFDSLSDEEYEELANALGSDEPRLLQ
jgi:hypothetical protein